MGCNKQCRPESPNVEGDKRAKMSTVIPSASIYDQEDSTSENFDLSEG